MFTNLIESSSHAREFKRRGSFFLFTTVTYFLLFAIAGLVSIYAYDARLEDQNEQEIVLLSPVEFAPPSMVKTPHVTPAAGNNTASNIARRIDPTASVNRPDLVPATPSAKPNTNPPVPDSGVYARGDRNSDPISVGGPGPGVTHGVGNVGGTAPSIEIGAPPLPVAVEKPRPQIIHKSVVLNGEALSLPKPPYPAIAKQLRIQGIVNVQVVISETGKVMSAKAVSGNAALVTAAQQAALQARFSPTMLGQQPVKVSGLITYNFVLAP